MPTEPEVLPQRIWLDPQVAEMLIEEHQPHREGLIEYVPASAQLAAVEDFRRRAIEAVRNDPLIQQNCGHVDRIAGLLQSLPATEEVGHDATD